MDYEIKARLAQVSPTMPASVQRNPCLNRQGEAERKKRYERQREKEREGNKGQTTHQQTQFQQIPSFSSSLHFSARVSGHLRAQPLWTGGTLVCEKRQKEKRGRKTML